MVYQRSQMIMMMRLMMTMMRLMMFLMMIMMVVMMMITFFMVEQCTHMSGNNAISCEKFTDAPTSSSCTFINIIVISIVIWEDFSTMVLNGTDVGPIRRLDMQYL